MEVKFHEVKMAICIRIYKGWATKNGQKKKKRRYCRKVQLVALSHYIFITESKENNVLGNTLYPTVKATLFHSPFNYKNISL